MSMYMYIILCIFLEIKHVVLGHNISLLQILIAFTAPWPLTSCRKSSFFFCLLKQLSSKSRSLEDYIDAPRMQSQVIVYFNADIQSMTSNTGIIESNGNS